ncbi:hypothetical protein [Botrimarina sp.]|uniref:hypothetical protein n=1 Tax=Botrimarina sp. TaxID=2795802 RepID=UPI0032ECA569
MANRESGSSDRPTPAERIAAIDQRQERLLAELDRLNSRIEAALVACSRPARASG